MFLISGFTALAQTTQTFPAENTVNQFTQQNSFIQINSSFYVGAVGGYYSTIQSAITAACATSSGGAVVIPAGVSPIDSIVDVTGGCTTAWIQDMRSVTESCYAWGGSSYNNADCTTGTTSFAINSFTGGSTVEIGATVTNPAFSASYVATPASAQITNTDGTNSPFNLTTPFTSATITGTFTKSAQSTTTFTLSATSTGNVTKTATQVIAFVPRVFGGVGTAGATGCTVGTTTCTLATATGTLNNAGLSASQINLVFGPYTASNQKIYVLLIGNSHTNWIDASTGFFLPFNSPTSVSFVNQYGDTVSMYLYETTNLLTGSFSPKPTN